MRKMYRKIREVIRMDKFKKLVAAAPVNLVGWAREELKEYADRSEERRVGKECM